MLVFLAALRVSLVLVSRNSSLVVCRLLPAVASLVEHRLQAHELLYSQHPGSTVEAHGLQSVGLVATQHAGFIHLQHVGVFLDQGLDLCPLHWQADL